MLQTAALPSLLNWATRRLLFSKNLKWQKTHSNFDRVKKDELATLQKQVDDLKADEPFKNRDNFQCGVDSVKDQYDLRLKSDQDRYDAKVQAVQDNTFSKFEELEAKNRNKVGAFFDQVGKSFPDKLDDRLENLV